MRTTTKSHFDPDSESSETVQIIFSLKEAIGALAETLKIFKVNFLKLYNGVVKLHVQSPLMSPYVPFSFLLMFSSADHEIIKYGMATHRTE